MKLIVKTLAAAAIAAAGFGATQAVAGPLCVGCSYNGNTFLGIHDPGNNDQSTFEHQFGTGAGAFVDYWAFTIDPDGAATANGIFLPVNVINNFLVRLYETTAPTDCPTMGVSCNSLTLGALVATGTPGDSFQSTVLDVALAAGTYAIVISGNYAASNFSNSYTGNLTTAPVQVPEPATLALVGVALLGAGAAIRRRKAA